MPLLVDPAPVDPPRLTMHTTSERSQHVAKPQGVCGAVACADLCAPLSVDPTPLSMQHKRKERIMLLTRKGFVKVAVEQGLDGGIIPVYHYGNTQVFDFWPQSLANVARKNRSALGFLVGRWGTPVPRKVPLYMVSLQLL